MGRLREWRIEIESSKIQRCEVTARTHSRLPETPHNKRRKKQFQANFRQVAGVSRSTRPYSASGGPDGPHLSLFSKYG